MSIYRILEFLESQQLVHKLKLTNRYVACVHITCNHEHEDRLCVLYFFLIYIHSLLHKLESGKDKLDRKDVLVVDEAGMLDTQLMLRITRAVSKAGAKMVLVGDRPAPIYSDRWAVAGDADPGGYREISTVRRQQNEVDRQATLDLARGRIGDAYNSYKARGFVSNPIPPAMSFILRGRVD